MRISISLAIAALAVFSAVADEIAIETPRVALKRVGRDLKSNVVPALFQDGKVAGEWGFWYVSSGDAPENMKLMELLPAIVWNPTRKKDVFLMTPDAVKDFVWPFFGPESCNFSVNPDLGNHKSAKGAGCAFTFTAKFGKPAMMILEGSLRHATATRVRVFLKKKDGTCEMLATSEREGTDLAAEMEYGPADKRYKVRRLYLRMQTEFSMEDGETVVFVCDNVGKSNNKWTPVFYAWDDERSKSEPYLFYTPFP